MNEFEQLRAAAKLAAGTTERALERLILAEKVVEAARAFLDMNEYDEWKARALRHAINDYDKGRTS